MTPTVFIHFLSKFVATPEVSVFFHLRPLATPSVPVEDRYAVTRMTIPNCYRLVIRHGYTDEVISEDLGMLICDQIRNFIIRETVAKPQPQPENVATTPSEKGIAVEATSSESSSERATTEATIESAASIAAARLARLHAAYEKQILYIVGKEQMRIGAEMKIWRRVALSAFLWLKDNTRSKIASMKIPTDQLVEVGFIKEV